MEKTKANLMYKRIEAHGANLNKIFQTDFDNIVLSKKLFSLENKAHKLATDYCNGDINTDTWDIETTKIMDKLNQILQKNADYHITDMCFINGDCRGYALKIYDDVMRYKQYKLYRDWGGYGILAPNFRS